LWIFFKRRTFAKSQKIAENYEQCTSEKICCPIITYFLGEGAAEESRKFFK
jgi:hypothetical protein